MLCPLCQQENSEHFHRDKHRNYYQCLTCSLVFVPPKERPQPEKEKEKYDLHQNSPENEGYRSFLRRIYDPISERIKPPATGLDFGSGPGPTLSVIFEENGYEMELFDPYYKNTPDVLNRKYDFITCTEVIEHLFDPMKEIKLLLSLLNDGGILGIMTQMVIDRERFKTWWYKNDPTHVCFYSIETFHWIAKQLNFELEFVDKDVVLISK